jgi:hypothetical protein
MVLYDGRETRWGRPVMKNVAGYDIPRLICGSRGRLGIVTAVTLRLWPRPRELRRVRVTGFSDGDPLTALAGAPPVQGVVWVGRRVRDPEGSLDLTLAGGSASEGARELERWASAEELELEPAGGDDPAALTTLARGRRRASSSAVYRLTFGRRYLSGGLDETGRHLRSGPGAAHVEVFPSIGAARVEVDGLEAAGPRTASAWLTAIAETSPARTGKGAPGRSPALRIERGGPAEHDAARRLRSAAARHLESGLLRAFGSAEAAWQADYM